MEQLFFAHLNQLLCINPSGAPRHLPNGVPAEAQRKRVRWGKEESPKGISFGQKEVNGAFAPKAETEFTDFSTTREVGQLKPTRRGQPGHHYRSPRERFHSALWAEFHLATAKFHPRRGFHCRKRLRFLHYTRVRKKRKGVCPKKWTHPNFVYSSTAAAAAPSASNAPPRIHTSLGTRRRWTFSRM